MKGPSAIDAIAALEAVANIYRLKIILEYGSPGSGKYQIGKKSTWRIHAMGKKFIDVDFIKCAGEAVKFIYNAHEANKTTK